MHRNRQHVAVTAHGADEACIAAPVAQLGSEPAHLDINAAVAGIAAILHVLQNAVLADNLLLILQEEHEQPEFHGTQGDEDLVFVDEMACASVEPPGPELPDFQGGCLHLSGLRVWAVRGMVRADWACHYLVCHSLARELWFCPIPLIPRSSGSSIQHLQGQHSHNRHDGGSIMNTLSALAGAGLAQPQPVRTAETTQAAQTVTRAGTFAATQGPATHLHGSGARGAHLQGHGTRTLYGRLCDLRARRQNLLAFTCGRTAPHCCARRGTDGTADGRVVEVRPGDEVSGARPM